MITIQNGDFLRAVSVGPTDKCTDSSFAFQPGYLQFFTRFSASGPSRFLHDGHGGGRWPPELVKVPLAVQRDLRRSLPCAQVSDVMGRGPAGRARGPSRPTDCPRRRAASFSRPCASAAALALTGKLARNRTQMKTVSRLREVQNERFTFELDSDAALVGSTLGR